jgi:hypothetical protein
MNKRTNISTVFTLLIAIAVSMPILGLYNIKGLINGIPTVQVVLLLIWLGVIAFGIFSDQNNEEE